MSLDVPNESIMEMVSSEKASPMGFNKWENTVAWHELKESRTWGTT